MSKCSTVYYLDSYARCSQNTWELSVSVNCCAVLNISNCAVFQRLLTSRVRSTRNLGNIICNLRILKARRVRRSDWSDCSYIDCNLFHWTSAQCRANLRTTDHSTANLPGKRDYQKRPRFFLILVYIIYIICRIHVRYKAANAALFI